MSCAPGRPSPPFILIHRHVCNASRCRNGTVISSRMWVRQSYVHSLIYLIAFFLTVTIGVMPGFAGVVISVNKNAQRMSVSVAGAVRYQFIVSTGRAGYGTPNGTYHPQRMATSWFSKLYYNSPMPHSIFFHRGYAIHGSYEINRLGGPASHGCIRLHPEDASALFALVKAEGMAATTIIINGSNPTIVRRHTRVSPPAYELQPDYEMQQPSHWLFPPFRIPPG